MDEFSNLRLKIKIYGGKKVKKNQKLIQAYWRKKPSFEKA